MLTTIFLIVLATIVDNAFCKVYVADQEEFGYYGFIGWKPEFNKPLYTAVLAGNVVEVNEPIILQDCGLYEFKLEATIDDMNFLQIANTPFFPPPSEANCTILSSFSINTLARDKNFRNDLHSIINLKAVYDHYILANSSIVAVHSLSSDKFKFVYEINGEDYFILNFSVCIIYFSVIAVIILVALTVFISRRMYVKYKYYAVVNITK